MQILHVFKSRLGLTASTIVPSECVFCLKSCTLGGATPYLGPRGITLWMFIETQIYRNRRQLRAYRQISIRCAFDRNPTATLAVPVLSSEGLSPAPCLHDHAVMTRQHLPLEDPYYYPYRFHGQKTLLY